MVSFIPIAIGVSALSLFFYMTGTKGLIVLIVLFVLLMVLIYWKQNMLLYMPGKSCLYFSDTRYAEIISTESTGVSTSQREKSHYCGYYIEYFRWSYYSRVAC